MATDFNHRALAVSQKVYGWLLRAYPPGHRAEYGPAMAQLFRDQCRDAWKESQTLGLTKLWLRVLPDLVSTSIRERIAALNESKTMNEKITSLSRDRTTPTAIFVRVFVAVFLITVIAATAITYILPESYASTARIKVESDNSAPSFSSQPSYDPYFIQTTFEVIQSQLVLNPVIDKLNLNVEWGKKYYNGQVLKAYETLQILRPRLKLEAIRNTKLIAITAYSDDRNEAARIANAVAEEYRDYRVNLRAELIAKGLAALQQQYTKQEAQIEATQAEMDALRQQLKIVGAAPSSSAPQEQPYWDKMRSKTQLIESHKLLYAKIENEKMDAVIPGPTLVQITDQAEPGHAPVKPNKTLNIFIGVVMGGFLGLIIGGAAAMLASRFGNRGRDDIAAA